MIWAGVSYLLATVITLTNGYIAQVAISPLQAALITTGIGLLGAFIGVLIDRAKSGPEKQAPQSHPDPNSKPSSGGFSLVAVLLTILLLCGGGGLALAYGVQKVGEKFIGFAQPDWERKAQEPGVQRLAAPATRKSGILTVVVSKVEVTERATRVTLTARNSGPESLAMPTAQLTVPGSATLQRDQASGSWSNGEVPAGGEHTGTLVFDGVIPAGVTRATLNFNTIFSMDFGAPRNLAVELTLIS